MVREFKVKSAGVYREADDAPRKAASPARRPVASRDAAPRDEVLRDAAHRETGETPVVIMDPDVEASPVRTRPARQPRAPAPVSAPAPAPVSAPPRRRGERNFLVRYDDHFVGVFEAEEDLTPRQAFVLVARDLAAADPAFAPEKLDLFKPVLLKAARPAKGLGAVRGKLSVVGGSLQALASASHETGPAVVHPTP